jgi:hypothetical protein
MLPRGDIVLGTRGESLPQKSVKADTKLQRGTADFRQALIERLQVSLGFAPKRGKKHIDRMIKWLADGEPTQVSPPGGS